MMSTVFLEEVLFARDTSAWMVCHGVGQGWQGRRFHSPNFRSFFTALSVAEIQRLSEISTNSV
jgi:hypothetical protein